MKKKRKSNVVTLVNKLESEKHESLRKFVTGKALYIDDMPTEAEALHAYIGKSDFARGEILEIDFKAVSSFPGVIDVFTAKDIPGVNDISPTGMNDEPVLVDREVSFFGQPLFVVVASTRLQARKAASLAKIKKVEKEAFLDIGDEQHEDYKLVTEPLTLARGNIVKGLKEAKYRVSGNMHIGGQDHFYLEGHIAMAKPEESGDLLILSSTQHPSEVQHMVAKALDLSSNQVVVRVKRMGGGFGGKETQSNLFAVIAAIATHRTGKTVKIRPDRDDDMIMTGKRHSFFVQYEVGFSENGQIIALDAQLSANCGYSSDLSGPITDRALFHSDNCYYYPNVRLTSKPVKTNTVSNTAFRGFGGPQGMLLAERVIQEIAFFLDKDPLDVRRLNLYGKGEKAVTPYYQRVTDNISKRIIDELVVSSDYYERRKEVVSFNKSNPFLKRGIALTPVKFGISFTATWFNQSGALVHVYTDGSIIVNHGGTEMGQGLHTKVLGIVASELGVTLDKIRISDTDTSKVPNTSATAASSGSDLNGMAAMYAAKKIKKRLESFIVKKYEVDKRDILFKGNNIFFGGRKHAFKEIVKNAYLARVQLWDAGFYRTPKIHWDRKKGKGRPFYYFSYGAAVSEVLIDVLTGEYRVKRVDILHDVGNTLNPTIDVGQIEGGFIQGMGWLTNEELYWDSVGILKTHAPSTYKIPLASDRPDVFNIRLADWAKNTEKTIKRSKAVGEPPFMLAISVHEAVTMAVASIGNYKSNPRLDTPATSEIVLDSIGRIQSEKLV